MKRKIIKIDEKKCNGCGACLPNCPEGAIKVIGGKARLVGDLFCDGLGACLGHCPRGAISIEEREAGAYDERKVMETIVTQGDAVIAEHLHHLKSHNQAEYYGQALEFLKERSIPVRQGESHRAEGGCPGARIRVLTGRDRSGEPSAASCRSELAQWPIQLNLVPAMAPFLRDADLLIAADCVACAYPAFHPELLKGKVLLLGCPKFDDLDRYGEKIGQIVEHNTIKSITYAHMEVPCCFGLLPLIKEVIARSGKDIPFRDVTIGVNGEKLT